MIKTRPQPPAPPKEEPKALTHDEVFELTMRAPLPVDIHYFEIEDD